MNKDILTKTFRNTAFAAIYIFAVSQIMRNGDKLFGSDDKSIFIPFAVLLLFSLSAAVVGGLVFGQTVYLFLDGKKKESVTAAVYSIGWLAIFTIISLVLLALTK